MLSWRRRVWGFFSVPTLSKKPRWWSRTTLLRPVSRWGFYRLAPFSFLSFLLATELSLQSLRPTARSSAMAIRLSH